MSYNTLKTNAQSYMLATSASEKARIKFKLVSAKKGKKSFAKYFAVSSGGRVTVKRGLAKGKYTLAISVTAAQTKNYLKTTKTKELVVTVK